MKSYSEAISVYQRVLVLLEAVHDPHQQAITQMNLGNVYLSRQQPAEALSWFQPARQTFRHIQDHYHLALVHHNMGLAHYQLRQWNKANETYSLNIEQQHVRNIVLLINTMDGLGLVYLAQGQNEKAIAIFCEALEQLSQTEDEPGHEHLTSMVLSHLQLAQTDNNL